MKHILSKVVDEENTSSLVLLSLEPLMSGLEGRGRGLGPEASFSFLGLLKDGPRRPRTFSYLQSKVSSCTDDPYGST